jgi:hypothetical protein
MNLGKTNENGFNCIIKLLQSTLKKEYDCKQKKKKKRKREGIMTLIYEIEPFFFKVILNENIEFIGKV